MREPIKSIAIPHQVVRHDIDVRDTYDGFSHRFEAVAPRLNRDRTVELVERKAPWAEVVAE